MSILVRGYTPFFMSLAFIGIGTNLGDKKKNILDALGHLAKLFELKKVSSFYHTKAVGGPQGQPDFINAVAQIEACSSPREVMNALMDIERQMGRVRAERWGPRLIDLDLLDYDGMVLKDVNLEIPHPRLHERAFVLAPLAEIAPTWRHPCLGKTVEELLGQLSEDDRNVIIAIEKFP